MFLIATSLTAINILFSVGGYKTKTYITNLQCHTHTYNNYHIYRYWQILNTHIQSDKHTQTHTHTDCVPEKCQTCQCVVCRRQKTPRYTCVCPPAPEVEIWATRTSCLCYWSPQWTPARTSEPTLCPGECAGWITWLTRASESLKNVLANLAVVFQNLQAQQNFHWPRPIGRGLS